MAKAKKKVVKPKVEKVIKENNIFKEPEISEVDKFKELLTTHNENLYYDLISYLRNNGVQPMGHTYNIIKLKELIENGKL
jgi:hypothetical protein